MTDPDRLREAIKEVRGWRNGDHTTSIQSLALVCDAAESTLPKTKMVAIWRVEYAQTQARGASYYPFSASFHTPREADEYAAVVKRWDGTGCIRVTGPHQQEVPARRRSSSPSSSASSRSTSRWTPCAGSIPP